MVDSNKPEVLGVVMTDTGELEAGRQPEVGQRFALEQTVGMVVAGTGFAAVGMTAVAADTANIAAQ